MERSRCQEVRGIMGLRPVMSRKPLDVRLSDYPALRGDGLSPSLLPSGEDRTGQRPGGDGGLAPSRFSGQRPESPEGFSFLLLLSLTLSCSMIRHDPPHKTCQFPRYRGLCHIGLLSRQDHPVILPSQPFIRPVCICDYFHGVSFLPLFQHL